MAAINDLIAQIQDAELRNKIEQEVNRMKKQKKFGLVFEEHLPECTPLYEMPVNCGSNVALKSGNINDIYRVIAINNEKALCIKEDEKAEWNIADLVVVAKGGSDKACISGFYHCQKRFCPWLFNRHIGAT